MEYPPVYLIMLMLFAGYLSPDKASEMISLQEEKEREKR